jgi:hypothetical protein
MNYKKDIPRISKSWSKRRQEELIQENWTNIMLCLFSLGTVTSSDSLHTSVIHMKTVHAGEYIFHG